MLFKNNPPKKQNKTIDAQSIWLLIETMRSYLAPQVMLWSLWRIRQESVDETKQLHHTFILSEVLMAFEQEWVLHTIRPNARKATGTLFAWNDGQCWQERLEANNLNIAKTDKQTNTISPWFAFAAVCRLSKPKASPHRFANSVSARNNNIKVLGGKQSRRAVLQLKGCETGQLFVDVAEHSVVNFPRLKQV